MIDKIKVRKKAQEEMIGFALIVIIVAIIALVLLAITSKKAVTPNESRELDNFLNSMVLYTTDCSLSPEHFYNMKELIKACSQDERCIGGRKTCDVMNRTLVEMLHESFSRGEAKSYYLAIDHNATLIRRILTLGNASCSGDKRGAELFYPANPGAIYIVIEGCYD